MHRRRCAADAHVPVEATGPEEIRAWGQRALALPDFFVPITQPGTIQLDGDTASGRAYMCEVMGTLSNPTAVPGRRSGTRARYPGRTTHRE